MGIETDDIKEKLQLFFKFQQEIRLFFTRLNYYEIIVPPAVQNPGMEPHLHPFALYSVHQKKIKNLYLHTSPEFKMKELLSYNFEKIFTLSYSFRDEPDSENHRCQFLMLEWYQVNTCYEYLMAQTYELISHLCNKFDSGKNFVFHQKTVRELFQEFLQADLDQLLTHKGMLSFLQENCKELLPPINSHDLSWEDLFYLLFLNKIEPNLKKYPFLILREYPAQLCALSQLTDDKKYCKRFELYLDGLEVANCFQELTDLDEQIKRFKNDTQIKCQLYNYELPPPDEFYQTLKRKIPRSSGIALGVERLFKVICQVDNPFIF